MRSRHYSSEAIVLSRKKYSEADRTLVLYSKHFGKISLLAKGVRKPKSKKRGSLEVFSQIKFAASRGKAFDIMTEAELIDSFKEVRKDLKKASVAYFFVEVANRLTQEEEKNLEFYSLIVKYLSRLKSKEKLRDLRESFIYDSLVHLGFWPKGRQIDDPDQVLESITERESSSVRVGKKLLS